MCKGLEGLKILLDRLISGEMICLLARKGFLAPWSSPSLQLKARLELH